MGEEINLMDRYPSSRRPIEERGRAMSVRTSEKADEFGKEYFDGDRLTGYGGYHYHPRFWTDTVRRFSDHYELADDASVLDIGCAKGFMMHDFKILMPDLSIRGIDVSQYAYDNAIDDMRPYIDIGDAKDLPYEDDSFDLVISINAIHNLGSTTARSLCARSSAWRAGMRSSPSTPGTMRKSGSTSRNGSSTRSPTCMSMTGRRSSTM